MPTFQPSQFSTFPQQAQPNGVLDWITDPLGIRSRVVAYATGSGTGDSSSGASSAVPSTTNYIEVLDDRGAKFSVRSNGRVEVLSGYPNVGTIYAPGDSAYNTLLRNLATLVPDNRDKLERVLGKDRLDAAIRAAESFTASIPVAQAGAGEGALPAKEEDVPLTEKPWFWPAVIITTSGVAAMAIVFWPKKGLLG